MDFFRNHKKQILIIVAIALVLLALFSAEKKQNATLVDNAFSFIVTPLQKGATAVGDFFSGFVDYIKVGGISADENKRNRDRAASLLEDNKAQSRRIALLEQENKKLSEMLAVKQKYAQYETVGTQIIAKDPSNWFNIMVLDKGKKDGVTAGMPLITKGGLVGKVSEAGMIYSKGQSILDSRSSISAMSARTNDLGVVRGDYELMASGLCRMDYIDAEAEIMDGDEIITSFLSEVYPSGLSIGYVKEIQVDSNGLTKHAIIQPSVDFKHLETLLVIKETVEKPASVNQWEE